jgi:hypothetical protein
MSYSLYIGEAEPEVDYENRSARIVVGCMTVEGAPLNSTDNHENCILPGSSTWSGFAERTGLGHCFFAGRGSYMEWWKDDEGESHYGLIYDHPGAFALTEGHYRAFVKAKEKYAYPESISDYGYDMKRLNWLIFWTRWALDNCKYPTFYNC